jgi:hypothetical protein
VSEMQIEGKRKFIRRVWDTGINIYFIHLNVAACIGCYICKMSPCHPADGSQNWSFYALAVGKSLEQVSNAIQTLLSQITVVSYLC